jgi:Glycosyltransferase family 87/WD40-like Beta Propeller Repeat
MRLKADAMSKDSLLSEVSDPVGVWVSRWRYIGEWVLLALLAATLGLYTLPRAWQKLNTDFPNYYLTARLAREGNNTARVYEWIWLQRQKDHREIDQRVIGMVPLSPFSALAVWPLALMPPLAAKHCWIILNIGLLLGCGILLRSLTQLPWRRIALVVALSFPLHRNFLYGQYYLLLLFVLTMACWLYIRQQRLCAGIMVGLGFGLKLFPILYLLYFLRKRDMRALVGGFVGSAGAAFASVAVFGWQVNRVYLLQVIPWTLRGEAFNPYALSTSSISTLLHRLFIYEPQWNPHPALHAPWVLAVFHPLLQTLIFAPALLLVDPKNASPRRVRLEWAAVLIASLAISTLPASYHFTLLILPVCFLMKELLFLKWPHVSGGLLLVYLAAGYSGLHVAGGSGWLALLNVQRLYALILLCGLAYVLLARQGHKEMFRRDRYLWVMGFLVMTIFSIITELRHQRGFYADYQYRLPVGEGMLMARHSVTRSGEVLFTSLLPGGYRTAVQRGDAVQSSSGPTDQLVVTAAGTQQWEEFAGRESTIMSVAPNAEKLHQAEFPVASFDGRLVAYLKEDLGRASIWLHHVGRPDSEDKVLTPPELDVLEMTFMPNTSLVFSATSANGTPKLFLIGDDGNLSVLEVSEARYPAASPDGKWLAYSRLEGGNWNLWMRDMQGRESRRITHVECNNIEPWWEDDSKTLIYGSDCGRALWFTALARRRVVQ